MKKITIYYLPKKILVVNIPVTIVEKQSTFSDREPEIEPIEAYIKGQITITPKLIIDEKRGKFKYSNSRGSWLKKVSQTVEYDSDGAGMLLNYNSNETNLLADILSVSIDAASSMAKIIPKVSSALMVPINALIENPPVPQVITYVERQIIVTQLISPEFNNKFNGGEMKIAISMPNIEKITMPKVTIFFNKGLVSNYSYGIVNAQETENSESIYYLHSNPVKIEIVVEDNSYIKSQCVLDDYVYLPQFGSIEKIKMQTSGWWLFGVMNTTLNFSASTGSLQKVGYTSESNIKDLLTDVKKAGDNYKTYQDEQKKIMDAKKQQDAKAKDDTKKLQDDLNSKLTSLQTDLLAIKMKIGI